MISKSKINYQITMFVIMVLFGILFNPMNVLAYRFSDLYFSLTLFYGGLLMASNMVWAHEIIHYLTMGHFNKYIFFIGVFLSIFVTTVFLRNQLFVNEKQWLKRMIGHHSTAITTTKKLLENRDNDFKMSPQLFRLAKNIINTQEVEISQMKIMAKEI